MDVDRVRDFEDVAGAWDEVNSATRMVECALPSQMTAAMAHLVEARKAMEAKVREVGLRVAGRRTPTPK